MGRLPPPPLLLLLPLLWLAAPALGGAPVTLRVMTFNLFYAGTSLNMTSLVRTVSLCCALVAIVLHYLKRHLRPRDCRLRCLLSLKVRSCVPDTRTPCSRAGACPSIAARAIWSRLSRRSVWPAPTW